MEIYSGDSVNICFEEGTTAIVGDELKICWETDYINHNDKIVCVPGKLRDTVKTVKMPDSVKHIGGKAFWGFYILSEVQFSSNLETISGGAFLDCENLKTLHLPKSLKIIDARAFGNNKIENIYFDGSIFDMEKIKIEKYHKAFDEIGKVHCTDCVVDFSQDKFYISELEFKGTRDEWKSKINSSWIYERTAKVICSDGVIDNTI
jgi:hypothetical protein